MRIAFLTNEFLTEGNFSGGIAHALMRTCLALNSNGFTPVVFVNSDVSELKICRGIQVYRVRRQTPLWIKILDRATFRKLSPAFAVLASASSIAKACGNVHAKHPFSIIHAVSYQATSLFARFRIPLVVFITSYEPLWRWAYEKPLTLAQRIIEFAELFAMKHADGLYAPSSLIAQKVEKACGKKVVVIWPPYVKDFSLRDENIYRDKFLGKKYLLFFGTIGRMKGCIAIAEIVQELLARHPNVYFAFIGKNEMFNGRAMIDLIKEKAGNFVERIIYSSPIRHDSLFPIIENAVAVVLPSRIDNIPNTCVEAMAVGQIVVGTNGASFDELIRDGESGYLCYPDDSKSLLQSIENVFALSPERRMRMAEKAKEKISEMEPQKTITRLIGLYREILKKKGVKIDLPKKRNIPQDS